jgi:hypothetical protein
MSKYFQYLAISFVHAIKVAFLPCPNSSNISTILAISGKAALHLPFSPELSWGPFSLGPFSLTALGGNGPFCSARPSLPLAAQSPVVQMVLLHW